MAFKNLLRRSAVTDAYEYKVPEKVNGYASEEPNIQGKEPSFGTNPVIKTFYPGKGSCQGRPNWVETPPKQLKEKVARAVSTSFINFGPVFGVESQAYNHCLISQLKHMSTSLKL